MKGSDRSRRTGSSRTGIFLRPVPVFLLVTAAAALASGATVLAQLAESYKTLSYGRISFLIHLLLPPAVGLMAAVAVRFAVSSRAGRLDRVAAGGFDGSLENEDRARAIIRTLSFPLVGLSLDGRVTFLNPAAHAMFTTGGDDPREAAAAALRESRVHQHLDEARAGEKFSLEWKFTGGGTLPAPATMRITGEPLIRGGAVAEILLTLEDISSFRYLQEDLLHSEERYRNIFNHAPCGIFFVDRNGDYLDANPAALRMLGYSLEELTRLNTREISADSPARIRKLIDSPGVVEEETRYMRKDGRIVDVELTASSYRSGDELHFIGIAVDITGRKNLERKALSLQASLSELISCSPEALAVLDREGSILELNDPAAGLLGADRASARSRPMFRFFSAGFPRGKLTQVDLQARTLTGREITVRCQPLTDEGSGGVCTMVQLESVDSGSGEA